MRKARPGKFGQGTTPGGLVKLIGNCSTKGRRMCGAKYRRENGQKEAEVEAAAGTRGTHLGPKKLLAGLITIEKPASYTVHPS